MRSRDTSSFIERARRQQIIASTIEVLAREGYAAATLARIAEHAGISKGVVSYHFGSRDDLMEAVVVDAYTRGGEQILPALTAEGSAAARLTGYLNANLDLIAAHRSAALAIGEIISNLRDEHGRRRFDEAQNAGPVDVLAAMLEQGQRDGEFGDFDARAVAFIIRDAIDGVGSRLRADIDFDIEGFARTLVPFVIRAITKPGKELT